MSFDYQAGYRYADTLLAESAVRPIDVLVAGLPAWQKTLATNLRRSAPERAAEGINPEHCHGVIARCDKELAK